MSLKMLLWRRRSGLDCFKVLSHGLFSEGSHGRLRARICPVSTCPLLLGSLPSGLSLSVQWPGFSRRVSTGTLGLAFDNTREEEADVGSSSSTILLQFQQAVQVCEIIGHAGWGSDAEARLEELNIHGSSSSSFVAKTITAIPSPLDALHFFHWLTLKGFDQDLYTYTTLLNRLGAAGHVDRMKELVKNMQASNVILDASLYEKLVYWCARSGDADGASLFSVQMKQEGHPFSASVYTSLFDLLVREEKYEDAVTLFLQMGEESILPSSETLAILSRCLLQVGKLQAAILVFTSLSSLKIKPSRSTLACLMGACAIAGHNAMLQEFGKKLRKAYPNPGKICGKVIGALQEQGKGEAAEAVAVEVWPELSVEDRKLIVNCTRQVQVAEESEFREECGLLVCSGVKVYISLLEVARFIENKEGFVGLDHLNVDWTSDTVYCILTLVKEPAIAWGIFQHVSSYRDFKHDIYNEIYMLHILAKAAKLSALKELLTDMLCRGVHLPLERFNNLLDDAVSAQSSKVALWIFAQLKEFGLKPNEVTFSTLIHALARDRNPEKALELCTVMQDLGFTPDADTYTAIIHSLGLAGRFDDAWSIYQRMRAANVKPNANTYTALLSIMDVVGDTGFATKLYREMVQSGIQPSEASQGIMIRLWQRAGDLAEAEKIEMQRKYSSDKKREDALQNVYEVLLEALAEQERSTSLFCLA